MSPTPTSLLPIKAQRVVLPVGLPVGAQSPSVLPGVLLPGRSRRAGAMNPITGCCAVSRHALNSGCISPPRHLHFSGEE